MAAGQRWFDDPSIGTINYDGGRNSEIYVGNGEWHPFDVTPNLGLDALPRPVTD